MTLDVHGLEAFRKTKLSGTPTEFCPNIREAMFDMGFGVPTKAGDPLELPTVRVSEIHVYRFESGNESWPALICKSDNRFEYEWSMGGTGFAFSLEAAEDALFNWLTVEYA